MLDSIKSEVFVNEGKDGFMTVRYPDGRIFMIKPFKGRLAVKLRASLAKYATGSLGGLLVGMMSEMKEGVNFEALNTIEMLFTGALRSALEEVDDPKFLDFFFELFTEVTVAGNPLDFDQEFRLDNLVPYDLARHVITYNFKSVFTELDIPALFKKMAKEEESSKN